MSEGERFAESDTMVKRRSAVVFAIVVLVACGLGGTADAGKLKPLCSAGCPDGLKEWSEQKVQNYFDASRALNPHVSDKTFQRFKVAVEKLLTKQSGGSGKRCVGPKENRRLTQLSVLMMPRPSETKVASRAVSLASTASRASTGSCLVGLPPSSLCCPKTWTFNTGIAESADHFQAASTHTSQCLSYVSSCVDVIADFAPNEPSHQYTCACARRACYVKTLRHLNGCAYTDENHSTFSSCGLGDLFFTAHSSYGQFCGSDLYGLCPT